MRLLVIVSLLALPAFAEPSLREQADAAFERGEHARALFLLEKAYEESKEPGLVANQGLVLQSMGEHARAAEAFERYLAMEPPPEKRRAAELALDRLKPEVIVTSEPSGARVYVDTSSTSSGLTPLKLRLVVGSHFLSIRKTGYADATPTFDIELGKSHTVRQVLKAEAVAAPKPEAEASGWGQEHWGWTAIGTGVAAGGAAGVFFYLTGARKEEQEGAVSNEEFDHLGGLVETYNTAYIVSGIVAVVAVGTGVTLLLTADDDAASEPDTLSVGPGVVRVRF
jgi:hypothetical protein